MRYGNCTQPHAQVGHLLAHADRSSSASARRKTSTSSWGLTPADGQEAPLPSVADFKAMIAKAKIYRDAQKLLRPMFQAFQAKVTAYTVSLVAEKLGDRIDLERI